MKAKILRLTPLQSAEVTGDALREYLSDKVAKWWLPDAFEFIDEIPKTSVGKFKKMALREQFEGYTLTD